jgi:aminoglycoside phosphotransferase (APT) family kinase protein
MDDTPLSFDQARLSSYLENNIEGFRRLRTASKFSGGQSNPTFLLTADSGKYVLRRKPPGKLLPSAHAVDREYRVLLALYGSDVPVARPYLLCEDEDVIGSMFYVMSYEEGRIFWDPALPEQEEGLRRSVHDEIIRVLAALHELRPDDIGLGDFGKPGNYFARQFERWEKQYRASETETIEPMEEAIAWLAANMPEDDGQVGLVHGDYRIDNFIFHPTKPQALTVLDWELSTLGHPMADLAYYCMGLRLPDLTSIKGLASKNRALLGIPDEAEMIRRYCIRRGIDMPSRWNFYLAFSFFRLSAILQGVYKRALDGTASNPQALELGKAVTPLAKMALDAIREPKTF